MATSDLVTETLTTAAAACSLRFENASLLRDGRATVVRARAISASGSVATVIKRFRPNFREHFWRERAGLRLLSTLPGEPFVPRLLYNNEAALTLVMEEVRHARDLDSVLAAPDATAAQDALVSTAARLGTLHASARALGPELSGLVPAVPSPGRALEQGIPAVLRLLELAHGVPAPPRARAELLALAASVDRPGRLSTLTLGDLAPSNVLLAEGRTVFLDLEYCGSRHAFYDAVFWRCVCPMPGRVSAEMDEAYLAGLREAGVALTPGEFERDMQVFAAHRLFWTLSWDKDSVFVADHDFVPGVSTRAMLCRYLAEYLRLSERCGTAGGGLVALSRALLDRLTEIWPDTAATREFPCFA